MIDFAVTEGELREMLPPYLGPHLSPLLRNLSPVLTSIAGQGGVRVFHESFRRFMTAELKRQGRSPADVLAPVITWLDGRGFFVDAKAYRFLLPALRRASRDREVLSRVNITFVSDSVAQAHPLDAILRNLALASDVAARARDWPALARCIELHRSAHTCFDESQNTWRDYWTAYVELFGPRSLAERLLFDGRPTLNRSDGLLACALVDDAGGTAPWLEYLSLPADADRSPPAYFDGHGKLDADELTTLAGIQGRCRLGEQQFVILWAARYLCSCNNDFKPLFLRAMAARLARMTSPALIERIARWSDPLRRGKPRISPRASAVLRLGIADEYARRGDRQSALTAALSAFRDADTPELVIACVAHGASGDLAVHAAVPLAGLTIAVGTDDFLRPENDVRIWVASVRLISRDRLNGVQILDAERRRLGSGGWYRCWLHYVIAMALADSEELSGKRGDIANAFHELVRDMHPFRGKPRACDLHAIHQVIAETVSWGLSLIRSDSEWRNILNDLSLVSKETASRLDQEDGGPLPTGTLIEILMPYAKDPTGGPIVRETIEHHVAYRDTVGTYYPTHANYAMRLARTRNAGGDVARAREAWAQGAVYLAGYGWHKDATLYEIIQSIPSLASLSQQEVLRFVADVQPLANAVIVHTDHRSTNHAPNAWFLALLRVHAVGALSLLATTITEDDHTSEWPILQAIHDVAKHVGDIASPMLLDAVLSTLRLKIDYDNETEAPLNLRLAPMIRLAAADRSRARQSLRRIAAEVAGVGGRHAKAVAAHLERSALELGMPLPLISQEGENDSQPRHPAGAKAQDDAQYRFWKPRTPAFPPDASVVELLAGLRSAGRIRRDDEHVAWPQVLLPLSYHLSQLSDHDRESDANRLLRFFARDTDIAMTARVHPLGLLAEMLDAAGPRYAQLACVAYALAYSATTLGRWSIRFSDQTHHTLAARAMAIDSELAKQVVIDEVGYYLRGNWYSVGSCSHLVELLTRWDQSRTAEKVWRQAFSVVSHRLPLPPPSGWFATLDLDALPDWTIDESLIALLLARLSDPLLSVKKAAMAGIVQSLRQCPEDSIKPLRWWFARNAPVTSMFLVLDILWRIESEPFTVTRAVEDILAEYVRVDLWGLRRLAMKLLARAGWEVDTFIAPSNPAGQQPKSSSSAQRWGSLLRAADVGDTLVPLSRLLPDLPERVGLRLWRMFEHGEKHKERSNERYRLAYGRDGDARPWTPVLKWETELFQTLLNEELNEITANLWARGKWTPYAEDSILANVLPHTRLHLGLQASQTPRPPWPKPATMSDGLGALPVVSAADPEFQSWIRLATVERQYLSDPAQHYAPSEESVTLFAGAVAIPLGETLPTEAFPFDDGDVDDWWLPATNNRDPAALPLGSLVRLARITDWLGDAFALVPPLALRLDKHLTPPSFGEPMIWFDSAGEPALALRTWWTRNANSLDAEPAETEGSDLVARPDIVGWLESSCGVPFRELRVVWRRSMLEEDED